MSTRQLRTRLPLTEKSNIIQRTDKLDRRGVDTEKLSTIAKTSSKNGSRLESEGEESEHEKNMKRKIKQAGKSVKKKYRPSTSSILGAQANNKELKLKFEEQQRYFDDIDNFVIPEEMDI